MEKWYRLPISRSRRKSNSVPHIHNEPNGNTISLTLNPSVPGQVTQVTDPVGRSLNLSYDASNRVVSVTDPIGRSVSYTYNAAGYLATVTDPAGGVTNYTYDSQNNLLTVKNPRGIVTEQNTYDVNGRVIQQIGADGGIYQFAYTLINPLIPTSPPIQTVVTDPLGRQMTYRFTPNQLFTDITDSTGRTKTFTLDATHNNLLTAISGTAVCSSCGDSSQGNQSFTLDANGNILTSTDEIGDTTTYAYGPPSSTRSPRSPTHWGMSPDSHTTPTGTCSLAPTRTETLQTTPTTPLVKSLKAPTQQERRPP